ncbi:MAG: hypothetical protein K2J60_16325, partial [Acetatifactor sp.]|nr:hypothetical protein [Acetatifactor sp.]
TDYDSRRTGNGLLDRGSTPLYSTTQVIRRVEPLGFRLPSTPLAGMPENAMFSAFFSFALR